MLHIVTALACEAKPLIRHYRLNGRQPENGFRIYENKYIRLIISGTGKTASAAACGYLQAQTINEKYIWLNIGIAGHGSLHIGEALLAHKISDASTHTAWYPGLPFTPLCQTAELISVDQVQTNYADNAAYDMEAAGFYATASRFNSTELVHVYKVISDNHNQPAHQVSAKLAEELITDNLTDIDALIKQLNILKQQTAQQQPPLKTMQQFQQRWHFTVSQQHQLQRLLQRWQACTQTSFDIEQFMSEKNSKCVLAEMEKMLGKFPLRFD